MKQKTVTMVVQIVVTLPADTDTSLLHLGNELEDFRVEFAGETIDGLRVESYTTVDILNGDRIGC